VPRERKYDYLLPDHPTPRASEHPVTGFPLTPPPPAFTLAGPAAEVLPDAAERIRAELRHTLDVDTDALGMDDRGRLTAGRSRPLRYPLEEHGLRTLLMHYTDAFPRATPFFLTLRPDVAAGVFFAVLADRRAELPGGVRLRLRGPEPAVFAAVPLTYAPYDVDAVIEDLQGATPPDAYAGVLYDAAESRLTVTLEWRGRRATDALVRCRVTASDAYGGAAAVSRIDASGTDLGPPVPTLRPRKRGDVAGRGGLLDYFRAQISALK
jgi:hypothetical protein